MEASEVHPVDLALELLGDEVPLQLQGRSKLAPGYGELVRQDGELPNQLSLECHKKFFNQLNNRDENLIRGLFFFIS